MQRYVIAAITFDTVRGSTGRGGNLTRDLIERGGNLTGDLTGRGGNLTGAEGCWGPVRCGFCGGRRGDAALRSHSAGGGSHQ